MSGREAVLSRFRHRNRTQKWAIISCLFYIKKRRILFCGGGKTEERRVCAYKYIFVFEIEFVNRES